MRAWVYVGVSCLLSACGSGGGANSATEASTTSVSTTEVGPTTAGPTTSGDTDPSSGTTASGGDSMSGEAESQTEGESETELDTTTSGESEGQTTDESTTQTDSSDTDGTETDAETETETETGEMTTAGSDTGEVVCDGAPLWDDPFLDGSLRLSGDEHYGFDAGPHEHAWICVEDMARINVCESTTIVLTEPIDTVIGAGGIGPLGDEKVTITVATDHQINLYMLVDVTGPPVDIWVDTPNACVTVTSMGQSELGFGGTGAGVKVSTEGGLTLNGWTGTNGNDCPFGSEFSGGGGVLPAPMCPEP